MINFYHEVPTIYSAASRDFQYLSWLINIVLNSVKHNVDDMYNLPNTKSDPRLTELLALTLGFRVRRNYDQDQLLALVEILPSILKCKGTEKALDLAATALLKSSGIQGVFRVQASKGQLELILPKELVDITLFIDLLPYIAPAGMTCKITRKTMVIDPTHTEIEYYDTLTADWTDDLMITKDNKVSGLSTMFDLDDKNFALTNFTTDTANNQVINNGLLNNTVIPALDRAVYEQYPVQSLHTQDQESEE